MDYLKDGVKYTKDSMDLIKTRGESAYPFMITFMSGMCSSCLACIFLPFIAIMPGKVAFFFNLGAILILISMALAKGWKLFCIDEFLCNKEKKWKSMMACGFILSMILCLFIGWGKGKWGWTLIFLLTEMVLLAYLVSFYFPGGPEGVTKMLKLVWFKTLECCKGCCGKKGGSA